MSNAAILSRPEEDGAEHKIGRLIRWYERICPKINAGLKLHDQAILALRKTQAGARHVTPDRPRQVHKRHKNRAYPAELLAKVEAMMRSQLSQRQIAEAMKTSRTTIRYVVWQIKAKARAGDKTDAGTRTTMTTDSATVGEAPALVNQETS